MKTALLLALAIAPAFAQSPIIWGSSMYQGDLEILLTPSMLSYPPPGIAFPTVPGLQPYFIAAIRTSDPKTESFVVTVRQQLAGCDGCTSITSSQTLSVNRSAAYTNLVVWVDPRNVRSLMVEERKPEAAFTVQQ